MNSTSQEPVTTTSGCELADLPRDVAAQVEGVDQHPVRVVEHRQVGHADGVAGCPLLAGPQRAGLLRRTLHAGLAGGEQQVGHLDAGRGPLRDRCRRAVLHVVGVGDHAQHPVEVGVGEHVRCGLFDAGLAHGSP